MNLYFRLIWLTIKSLFSKKLDPNSVSTISLRVLPGDLDLFGHMNNGRYFTLMDLGRTDLTLRTKLMKLMFTKKWRPVVASEKIRFHRALKLFERFQLKTRLIGWYKHWVYMEQVFLVNGKVCASGYVKVIFNSPHGKVSGETLAKELGVASENAELPEFIHSWQSAELASKDSFSSLAAH